MVLGAVSFAYVVRLTRSAVAANMHADYVRTATAKGLSRPRVVVVHILRNSLIPVATFLGAAVALWWPAGFAFGIVWIAAVVACGYASVGSMLASLAMAPVLWFGIGRTGLFSGVVCAVLIIVRHRENLARLRGGTENRFSLLKAGRQQ